MEQGSTLGGFTFVFPLQVIGNTAPQELPSGVLLVQVVQDVPVAFAWKADAVEEPDKAATCVGT